VQVSACAAAAVQLFTTLCCLCVARVRLLMLHRGSLALSVYSAHDFADKFPSPQEKLLAFFERIEIG